MAQDREDWVAVVRELLGGEQQLAFRKLARLVTGFLVSWRAYDFRDEWDDAVQEVALATARAVAQGRLGSSAQIVGYVRNASRNRFVDWLRRRQVASLEAAATTGIPLGSLKRHLREGLAVLAHRLGEA